LEGKAFAHMGVGKNGGQSVGLEFVTSEFNAIKGEKTISRED